LYPEEQLQVLHRDTKILLALQNKGFVVEHCPIEVPSEHAKISFPVSFFQESVNIFAETKRSVSNIKKNKVNIKIPPFFMIILRIYIL
jgi:hypothetical protein